MQAALPDALIQDHPGGRIRVKRTDRYSAVVQVLTREGTLNVTARGSRQLNLQDNTVRLCFVCSETKNRQPPWRRTEGRGLAATNCLVTMSCCRPSRMREMLAS